MTTATNVKQIIAEMADCAPGQVTDDRQVKGGLT